RHERVRERFRRDAHPPGHLVAQRMEEGGHRRCLAELVLREVVVEAEVRDAPARGVLAILRILEGEGVDTAEERALLGAGDEVALVDELLWQGERAAEEIRLLHR